MSSANAKIPTQERERRVMSGWLMLPITLLLYIAGAVLIALAFVNGTTTARKRKDDRARKTGPPARAVTAWRRLRPSS